MKAKKSKRERSEQMQQVSAGLRDVLGMTQWRKEHPHATWAEIEAAVDERINQLRAQLIQDMVQMGRSGGGKKRPEGNGRGGAPAASPRWAGGDRRANRKTRRGEG